MNKFCGNCGASFAKDVKFCPECGESTQTESSDSLAGSGGSAFNRKVAAGLTGGMKFLGTVVLIAALWLFWCAFPGLGRTIGIGGLFTKPDATLRVTVPTTIDEQMTAEELTQKANEACAAPFLLRPLVDDSRNVTVIGIDADGNDVGSTKVACGTNFREATP